MMCDPRSGEIIGELVQFMDEVGNLRTARNDLALKLETAEAARAQAQQETEQVRIQLGIEGQHNIRIQQECGEQRKLAERNGGLLGRCKERFQEAHAINEGLESKLAHTEAALRIAISADCETETCEDGTCEECQYELKQRLTQAAAQEGKRDTGA